MTVVASRDGGLQVDVCRGCQLVWLDNGEIGLIPIQPQPISEAPLPEEAAEIMAAAELDLVNRTRKERFRTSAPVAWWQWVVGFFGLPVREHLSLKSFPYATWAVAALMVAVSVVGFSDVESTVQHLGFVPAEPHRVGGLTLVTSFLIHGSWFHLLGNLYFLLLVGQNVEDKVGTARFLGLLALAALAGDLAHALIDPRPEIPLVGASGGIFGLFAFYGLAFRRHRFKILFWRLWPPVMAWIGMSAGVLFGIYAGLQLFGVVAQLDGMSQVSALAHVGGAAAGVVAWWAWSEETTNPAPALR